MRARGLRLADAPLALVFQAKHGLGQMRERTQIRYLAANLRLRERVRSAHSSHDPLIRKWAPHACCFLALLVPLAGDEHEIVGPRASNRELNGARALELAHDFTMRADSCRDRVGDRVRIFR